MRQPRLNLPEEEIIQRYLQGETTTELAVAFGAGATTIRWILRKHKVKLSIEQRKRRQGRVNTRRKESDPTPEEIAEMCKVFKARSLAKHKKVAPYWRPPTFTPTVYSLPGIED